MANGRDTYYPQQYKNKLGGIEKHYVWESNVKKAKHKSPITGEVLNWKKAYFEPEIEAPMMKTQTMSTKMIQIDRKKRATEHFKKEVLPTINRKDAAHFKKKYGIKS